MSEHKANSAFKIGLNLALACIISGAVIAATYYVTNPVAEAEAIKAKSKAMQDIVPEAQYFKEVPAHTGWFYAEKDGKTIAYIVPSENSGYGGAIRMLVGLTPDGKVIKYKILKHNETPGLGDKANKEPFMKQFEGKGLSALKVVKVPTKDNIQALTGATITSTAVTNAVRFAIEDLDEYLQGENKNGLANTAYNQDAKSEATARASKSSDNKSSVDAKSEATKKKGK